LFERHVGPNIGSMPGCASASAARVAAAICFTLLLSLVSPAGGETDDAGMGLPSWLMHRAEDARWLQEPGDRPRALVEVSIEHLSETGKVLLAEIVMWMPDPETPAAMIAASDRYDSCLRSRDVEVGFVLEGHTFTAVRAHLGPFRLPLGVAVTRKKRQVEPERIEERWSLLAEAEALVWLRAHEGHLAKAMKDCGKEGSVSDYLEEVEDRIHAVNYLEGGQVWERGWYRYQQRIRLHDPAANFFVRVSKGRQLPAALKAALVNTDNAELAGGPGLEGALFDVRFNGRRKAARPGRH
jgi:hypothetical protein